jgi:hypothetical protein
MAPQVKKVRTAFLCFQADQLQAIKGELGPQTTMGEAMTEVSTKQAAGDELLGRNPAVPNFTPRAVDATSSLTHMPLHCYFPSLPVAGACCPTRVGLPI